MKYVRTESSLSYYEIWGEKRYLCSLEIRRYIFDTDPFAFSSFNLQQDLFTFKTLVLISTAYIIVFSCVNQSIDRWASLSLSLSLSSISSFTITQLTVLSPLTNRWTRHEKSSDRAVLTTGNRVTFRILFSLSLVLFFYLYVSCNQKENEKLMCSLR